jgi:hypothetical protein
MGPAAESVEQPDDAITHVTEHSARAIRVAAANGIRILSPDEIAAALPHLASL